MSTFEEVFAAGRCHAVPGESVESIVAAARYVIECAAAVRLDDGASLPQRVTPLPDGDNVVRLSWGPSEELGREIDLDVPIWDFDPPVALSLNGLVHGRYDYAFWRDRPGAALDAFEDAVRIRLAKVHPRAAVAYADVNTFKDEESAGPLVRAVWRAGEEYVGKPRDSLNPAAFAGMMHALLAEVEGRWTRPGPSGQGGRR